MTSAWDTLENLGFNNKKNLLTQEKEKKEKTLSLSDSPSRFALPRQKFTISTLQRN
jgi:hypothetical protein